MYVYIFFYFTSKKTRWDLQALLQPGPSPSVLALFLFVWQFPQGLLEHLVAEAGLGGTRGSGVS